METCVTYESYKLNQYGLYLKVSPKYIDNSRSKTFREQKIN